MAGCATHYILFEENEDAIYMYIHIYTYIVYICIHVCIYIYNIYLSI